MFSYFSSLWLDGMTAGQPSNDLDNGHKVSKFLLRMAAVNIGKE
jgi:hypothetical protein